MNTPKKWPTIDLTNQRTFIDLCSDDDEPPRKRLAVTRSFPSRTKNPIAVTAQRRKNVVFDDSSSSELSLSDGESPKRDTSAPKNDWKTESPEKKKTSVPSFENLEERVKAFDKDLREEVAFMARCHLRDAKDVINSAHQNHLDKVNPWAAAESVKISEGPARLNKITAQIETRHHGKSNNYRAKATIKTLSGKSIKDQLPAVPKYTAITNVKRNFLTADDEVLRFIPYLEDDPQKNPNAHKRLMKELEEAYSNSGLSQRESELGGQVLGYFDSWLPQINLSVRLLQRYILLKRGHTLKKQKKAIDLVLKSLGGPVSEDEAEQAREFTQVFESVFKLDIVNVILPEPRLRELIRGLNSTSDEGEEEATPVAHQELFATLANWMCLVCGVAYCQVHGDYIHSAIYRVDEDSPEKNRENVEYEYNYQPLGLNYADLVRKQQLRRATMATLEPENTNFSRCSEFCYVNADEEDIYDAWSDEKLKLLQEFAVVFINKLTRSCSISVALDKPCWQVYRELDRLDPPHEEPKDEQPSRRIHDKPQWYNRDKKSLNPYWGDMTDVHKHEERGQVNTCAHEGPCTSENCGCFQNNTLCERWCMCSDDCGRKFTGCSCASSGLACTENSCICIQMNRECGPECASCGAIDRINPVNKHNDGLFETGCQNVMLQRGVSKRLVIGESTLEGVGFGAYIAEPAKKGDYIGDYVGEIITSQESERRGILYERKHSSFLFDLNGEWTVDAARYGNKTRFINHGSVEARGLNITAKIMLANGQHRIKFVALRDIEVGEELLFDYGKKFENHLTQKSSLLKKKTSKVVTGRAELDALDGLTSENTATRNKIAAKIRGGRGTDTAGKGKARKSAGPKSSISDDVETVVAESLDSNDFEFAIEQEEEEEDEEDSEDSDDDLDEAVGRRPRRNIKKPKRYTR